MTVIGTAEILIVPQTAGFAAALEGESAAGYGKLKQDSEKAGKDAGAGLRTGVKAGSQGIENDLGNVGAAGGANLRRGVTEETGKLGSDLERDGSKAGAGLSKGMSGGLSKLANLVSNTGLPLGGLSTKLDNAGSAMGRADSRAGGLGQKLDHLGGVALLGVGAAAVVVGAATVKMAEGMQTADASIASAEGTSVKFAKGVGDAFLSTAGKSEFSGKEMAAAFAPVAGQLKATEGHVLSAGESLKVMTAASNLAEAKQISLGSATETVAKVMQTFGMHSSEAGHATDVLFSASTATGVSVEALGSQLAKVRGKLGETGGSVGQLSSLLVDMAEHGITGRGAMSALNSGMNTLLKSSEGVTVASQAQSTAFASMSPPLKALAKQYESGAISTKDFKKQAEELGPAQSAQIGAFTKASTAVQTANEKYKAMGLTVFDTHGKFVGMGSIIEQLGPRFAKMNQEQQLATATTLFGAGAAKQMTTVIDAGTPAYQKATAAVEKHGTAESAAKKQSETLHGELKILGAEFVDVGTKIGATLIPIVTKMVGAFVSASTFVMAHKAILIALGVLIGGVLTTAIAVFTVNKMAAFGQSFVKAGEAVGLFAKKTVAETGVVEGAMVKQDAAVVASGTVVKEQTGQMALEFEGVGAAAGTAEGEVAAAETGIGTAATGAATVTGEASTSMIASFAAVLPEIALVVGAIVAAKELLKAFNNEANPNSVLGGEHGGGKAEYEALRKTEESETGKKRPTYTEKQEKEGHYTEGSYAEKVQGATGAVVKGAGSVEDQVLKFWISKGFSPNAAAGFAGNAAQESTLNPGASGGGLYQQSGHPGKGTGSVQQQSEQVLGELTASQKAAINKARTPAEAARLIMELYEEPQIPRGTSVPVENKPHREQAATEAAGHIKNAAATEKNTGAVEGNTKAHGGTGKAAKEKATAAEAYVSPFANATGFKQTRTDQGVDYANITGSIGAIGAGTIVKIINDPGGFGKEIVERIEQGAHKGQYTYLGAETGATLTAREGQHVKAGQQIARGKGTGSIEMGFASGPGGVPITPGSGETVGGKQFAAFMQSIGKGGSALSIASKTFETEQKAVAAQEKVVATKIGEDTKQGQSVLSKNVAAIHSKNLEQLKTVVGGSHEKYMKQLEGQLDKDHKEALKGMGGLVVKEHASALAKLITELTKVHKEAVVIEAREERAAQEKGNKEAAQRRSEDEQKAADANREAYEAKEASDQRTREEYISLEAASITKAATITAEESAYAVTGISDRTKVELDKQAEVGLSGTAEIAARLQTVLDEVTGGEDVAIGAAKLAADQAQGTGAIAEALAAANLSNVESAARLKEAEAQAALDKAKGTASTPGSTAGPAINIESLVINGTGLSSGEILNEFGWGVKTGALPVAQPVPVPA